MHVHVHFNICMHSVNNKTNFKEGSRDKWVCHGGPKPIFDHFYVMKEKKTPEITRIDEANYI